MRRPASPQTGDLDLHCLAEDVHPLLGRPATPRLLARTGRYASESRSSGGAGAGGGHLCSDSHTIGRPAQTGRKKWANANSSPSDQTRPMCMFCIAAIRARTSREGEGVVCPNLLHISANGRLVLQAGADCTKVQLNKTGQNRTWLSLAIKHTERNTKVHKHTDSS